MSLWHKDACICVSVYPFTIRKCFFSNMPRWIFVTLGYNDFQVGGQHECSEVRVKDHLGVIFGNWSNMLKTFFRLHNSIDFDETRVKRSLAIGSFACLGIPDLASTWGQIFQNVLILLKLIIIIMTTLLIHRLNLLSRSSKVKGQLEVRFSKCCDWAQIWQEWFL